MKVKNTFYSGGGLFDQEKHHIKKKIFFVFRSYKIHHRHGTLEQRSTLSSRATTGRLP